MVLFFSGSAISRRFVKVLEPGTAVGSNPVSVVAKMFVGWLTVRGGRLLVVGRVCREYLIIVGSIPNGAGTMVLWFCSFLLLRRKKVLAFRKGPSFPSTKGLDTFKFIPL